MEYCNLLHEKCIFFFFDFTEIYENVQCKYVSVAVIYILFCIQFDKINLKQKRKKNKRLMDDKKETTIVY